MSRTIEQIQAAAQRRDQLATLGGHALDILLSRFLPAMRGSRSTEEAEIRCLECLRDIAREARSLGLIEGEACP